MSLSAHTDAHPANSNMHAEFLHSTTDSPKSLVAKGLLGFKSSTAASGYHCLDHTKTSPCKHSVQVIPCIGGRVRK